MDTSHSEPSVTQPAKRGWRRHSTEFKSRVIELASQRDASVAAVALANGLNANMLRRWVREAGLAGCGPPVGAHGSGSATHPPAFVPVALSDGDPLASGVAECKSSPKSSSLTCSVAVEIRRGATTVHASLPLDERSAAWLREVLG